MPWATPARARVESGVLALGCNLLYTFLVRVWRAVAGRRDGAITPSGWCNHIATLYFSLWAVQLF